MLWRILSFSMIAYVLGVVGVNLGFSYVPMLETPFGVFSPMAVVVGAIFVLRDYAQRQAGHFVLFAMLFATFISYMTADPTVAIASALAFATSEVVDYLVYTFTKRSFRERVLISSLISTPVDTAVFLFGISSFGLGTFLLMIASKLIAALAIFVYYGETEQPLIADDGEDLENSMFTEFDVDDEGVFHKGYPHKL